MWPFIKYFLININFGQFPNPRPKLATGCIADCRKAAAVPGTAAAVVKKMSCNVKLRPTRPCHKIRNPTALSVTLTCPPSCLVFHFGICDPVN